MPIRAESRKTEILARVASLARQRLSGAAADTAEAFIKRFYANVAADDLAERSPEDLYGSALALWSFGRLRGPAKAKVRVYNPRLSEHGWHSNHTVVEIVNDDMPFLVDSITAEINRRELSVHLVIHPVVAVVRDEGGAALGLSDEGARESFMHVEIDAQGDQAQLDTIRDGIQDVLDDVRACVVDWRAMLGHVQSVVDGFAAAPPPRDAAEIATTRDFLTWLAADNFTFLGYREYEYHGEGTTFRSVVKAGSGLGLARAESFVVFDVLRRIAELPATLQHFVRAPDLLRVAKANRRSSVHRPAYLDAIGIKVYDADGTVVGEKVFLGLFTSAAYMQRPREIPLLRDKVAAVVAKADFASDGHNAKALQHILETYPREELFQSTVDELYETALGILRLQERQRIALFLRRDPFDRFVSALVYAPRDRFNTELRDNFHTILAKAYAGRKSAFYVTLADDSALVRCHFIVGTTPGAIPDIRVEDVEAQLVEAGRGFADRLKDALVAASGEERGLAKLRRFQSAFPAAYREHFTPEQAVADIASVEAVLARETTLALNLYRSVEAAENELRLRIFHRNSPVPLSDVLPMLESMGLKVMTEEPFRIQPLNAAAARAAGDVYMHDLSLVVHAGVVVDLARVKPLFEEAFAAVWAGNAASDGFNRLVLSAAMSTREVTVLRALAAYLRQAGIPFSQPYMEDTLARHPKIARRLVDFFKACHDPAFAGDRDTAVRGIAVEIAHLLDDVANLDEDRILRRFLNLLQAALRTNYFQAGADGAPKTYLSIKFDSQKIDELPLPRPLVEVWVYSTRVEAVHLRGGKVARGGIRWSDRREDFRTEILGLIKAQMVKNAVIVPVGSKGGFFVKRPPPAEAGREAYMAEGIACYQTLMRGLLDITDNIVAGKIVPPKNVVRRDGDDPYLVVAADKGTATFSDIANAISIEYGHWLGDAFASGGSAGYDHKGMGITARGAWEAVKRHFREMGIDTQAQAHTCVGVGDMSGDVFGNGLLRSRFTKLVGAFDHRHIFIDPNPDAEAAFAERARMFKLPRSSWADYDPKLISAGGGVFDRKAKSIKLTPQIKQLFGISADSVTPFELMKAMLLAEVDLLWFGGIGNYIKASSETNAEAGDRANDAIRVNGADIRARVVGEGANLGATQRGRIEYASKGGRINTDAIDNSAGVATSDHEVNIKILLGAVMAQGDMTLKQRDVLLAEMTDELGLQVLRDNYLQTQAISLAEAEGPAGIERVARLMRHQEKTGRLNRTIEFLPDDEAMAARAAASKGLTRPEFAVMLAYAKMGLYEDLLASNLPDDPYLSGDLVKYFPHALRRGHKDAILKHPLRREIVATMVTNSLVNRCGIGFAFEQGERSGRSPGDVARAYLLARDAFGLLGIWAQIEALDNKAEAALQLGMLRATMTILDKATTWLLRNLESAFDIAEALGVYGAGIAELKREIGAALDYERQTAFAARRDALVAGGVPAALASDVAALGDLAAALDLVRIQRQTKADMARVAQVYFALGARLGFDWLRETAARIPARSAWATRAIAATVDDLDAQQTDLAVRALAAIPAGEAAGIDAFLALHKSGVARYEAVLGELRAAGAADLAALTVAGRELRALVAGAGT
ncbi:MAG: NAD-glutamate dehydrogenase [Telmatospirillum sp.]|nr:NAD-glutamate dehydrogenase [Telmatospirillum sp.]